MLDTAYVITWRYYDGSGSGAIAACVDRARADALLKLLADQGEGKFYKIEPVAFDATPPGTPAGVGGGKDDEALRRAGAAGLVPDTDVVGVQDTCGGKGKC